MVVRSYKVVEIIYKSLVIQSALNICPNYNYLHKVTYTYKTKKRNGVSSKTAIIQMVKEWKIEEGAWQYRELGSAHGISLGCLRG